MKPATAWTNTDRALDRGHGADEGWLVPIVVIFFTLAPIEANDFFDGQVVDVSLVRALLALPLDAESYRPVPSVG